MQVVYSPKLAIFDLDGTISINPDFYRAVYSGTLNETVSACHGEEGLQVLARCRTQYQGKGELALLALNIPFSEWAQRLINAPLDKVAPDRILVQKFHRLECRKVVYTGSPVVMAERILQRIGFGSKDFDQVIGWQEPEFFPIKWTGSPVVFQGILTAYGCRAHEAWAIGDQWETDLRPAKVLGSTTMMIRPKEKGRVGNPNWRYDTPHDFLDDIHNLVQKAR